MRIRIMLLLLGVIIAPADAAMPRPAEVIVVSSFSFRPSQFELQVGEPVLLEFRTNRVPATASPRQHSSRRPE